MRSAPWNWAWSTASALPATALARRKRLQSTWSTRRYAGINFIDTVRAYGESERILGPALAGRRHEVVLATKADPRPPAGGVLSDTELRRSMQTSLETSLRLLRTDYLDVWMIHSIDAALLNRHEVLREIFQEAPAYGV